MAVFATAFNRTVKELKFDLHESMADQKDAFNRTVKELKLTLRN
jgi:hypothetical protein